MQENSIPPVSKSVKPVYEPLKPARTEGEKLFYKVMASDTTPIWSGIPAPDKNQDIRLPRDVEIRHGINVVTPEQRLADSNAATEDLYKSIVGEKQKEGGTHAKMHPQRKNQSTESQGERIV